MACINPDASPTQAGRRMLQAIKQGASTPEEVARQPGLPIFSTRAGFRDFIEAGMIEQEGDVCRITEKGMKFIT